MDKKIKLIAIILGVFSLTAAIIAFSYITRYNSLMRDFQELQKEEQSLRAKNEALTRKITQAQEEVEGLREAQKNLQREAERLASEHMELKNKYTALSQERDKLMERIQQSLAGAASLTAKTASATPSSDEYWAGILKEKGDLELQMSNLKDTLKDNQLKIDELSKEKLSLDLDIQRLTKEKTDIQRQLEYNEKLSDSMSLQLVREKEDKRKIQKQAGLMKEENYALRSRIKDTMNTNVSLEKKLKETEDRRMELYNRLNQMDQLLQNKLSEVLETKQDLGELKKGLTPSSGANVELPPIVVPSAAGGLPAAKEASSGRIVSINEEKDFVILDRGEAQGIYPGQTLAVYQDSQQIATLEVIQVRPNVSAADIKEKTARIKAGDVVR